MLFYNLGLTWWLNGKESDCQTGDVGAIAYLERSPGEANGHPLQYSCLGNPMDRGAWLGYSSWNRKRVRHDLATKQQQQLLQY